VFHLPVSLGVLVRRRLREIQSSTEDVAEALDLPASYVEDARDGVLKVVMSSSERRR